MNAPTDWVSAIAILGAGLLIGAIIFFFVRRKTTTIDTNLERKDLEAKRDALVAQLRALPDDAVDEHARLERETADVLRALDVAPLPATRSSSPTPVPQQPTPTINPAIKGFLWGAGSFAALAALGYFVMQSSTPKDPQQMAPMSQQQTTTDPHPQTPTTDPQVLQLEAAVQKDPNNLALRNDLAQAYLERDNLMAVFEQTKFILAKNPNDSRALTFQALVRMAMGEADNALKMLRQAIQADPKNLDARVSLAWVYTQNNDTKSADAAIADAIQASPNDKARLEEVLRQMKASAAGEPAAQQASAGQLPEGHPAIDPSNPPTPNNQPPAAGAANSVRVTLSLDPAATTRNGVLYVMARSASGGPPIAVKRLLPTSFPMTVELSSADSMMGQPLPASFRLEARLDSDGDAATKLPTDPRAVLDNVAPGAVVTLALK
jgi:tetratricopeptide (TPR) repeat protein